jgi:hypothetical protein
VKRFCLLRSNVIVYCSWLPWVDEVSVEEREERNRGS